MPTQLNRPCISFLKIFPSTPFTHLLIRYLRVLTFDIKENWLTFHLVVMGWNPVAHSTTVVPSGGLFHTL